MIKVLFGISVFVLLTYTVYAEEPPRFLILCQASGDTAVKYSDAYETVMESYLKEAFTCAKITKRSSVVTSLERERINQLLGDGEQQTNTNFAKEMNYDYLVRLILKTFEGKQIFVRAVCLARKDVKCVADGNYILVPMDYQGVKDGINEMSKTLVDKLYKYEICPFKGDINIKIISTKKENTPEEYPVYCNGLDGYYKKTVSFDKYSENDWTITKTGKESATGTVKFNLSEETIIDEINPCYECSPKKQGQRSYYEKSTTYADIEGLSNESESYGIPVDDARVELIFSETGTYRLKVSASSTQGEKRHREEINATGVCGNENLPPETWTSKIDEGIDEILGPFTGTPQDKTLSYKITIPRKNEITGEDETISYEFNLTRE